MGALDTLVPLNPNGNTAANLVIPNTVSPTGPTPQTSNNLTDGTTADSILMGQLSAIVFNGKKYFDNTQTGFILGDDPSDGLIKFYLGTPTSYFNFDGTNIIISGTITAGAFQTGTTGQRIRITNASAITPTQPANSLGVISASNNLVGLFDSTVSVDVLLALEPDADINGLSITISSSFLSSWTSDALLIQLEAAGMSSLTGRGIHLSTSSTGDGIFIENQSTGIPLHITNIVSTSTHFKKEIVTDGITFWKSDGTTPNGNLSGTAGDICINADNSQLYYCTGSTVWTTPGVNAAFLGDGSDGSVTFDGSTTILGFVPSSSIYTMTRDIFCTGITINNSVTVKTNGYQIFCTGTLAVNGTIDRSGNAGGAGGAGGTVTVTNTIGVAGSSGTAGAALPAGSLPITPAGGVGGQGQGTGNLGGPIVGGNGTNVTNSLFTTANNAVAGGVAGGGAFTAGTSFQPGANAGAAGVVSSHSSSSTHLLKTFINTFDSGGSLTGEPSGSGGGGASSGQSNLSGSVSAIGGGGGGGGGASPGGMVFIFALNIIVGATGHIFAIGGVGGNGGAGGSASGGTNVSIAGGGGGGGAGGNGGIIALIYHTFITSGSVLATKGTGGPGGLLGVGGTGGTNGSPGSDGIDGTVYQLQF